MRAGVAVRQTRGARAGAVRVARHPARARVHRGDELEPGGEPCRPADAGDRDVAVLERLAERLQDVPRELRQLVEEQDAVGRERDLAGRHARTATDHRGVGQRVMGCSHRRPATKPLDPLPRRPPRRRSSPRGPRRRRGAAADAGSSWPEASCRSRADPMRSKPWPPASATSRARRASSWPRTSARSGASSSIRPTSSTGGGSSDRSPSPGAGELEARRRRPPTATRSQPDRVDCVPERVDADHLDIVDQTRLSGRLGRHDRPPDAMPPKCGDHRQDARHGPDVAAERQLADQRDARAAAPGPARTRGGSRSRSPGRATRRSCAAPRGRG